jgi:hypothetical protein
MNEDLPSINDFIEDRSNLPSINESVDENLPSYKDFLEKKKEVITEETGDNIVVNMDGGVGGSWSVQETPEPQTIVHEQTIIREVQDNSVIISLIEQVRDSIPEVKSYDKELFDLVNLIEEVRSEIPVVPEQPEIPEVRYYDEQISELQESIQEVKERDIPDFGWISKSFTQLDESQDNLTTSLSQIKNRLDMEMNNLLESIEVIKFETGVDNKNLGEKVEGVDERLTSTEKTITESIVEVKDKIYKELRDTSLRVWNLKKEFQEDDKKLKTEVSEQYKKLRDSILQVVDSNQTQYSEVDSYLNSLKEEITNLPEVKYYDEQIDKVNESVKSVKNLVEVLENKLNKKIKGLKESILVVPPTENNTDPLTPLDQNFATLDDLSNHYRTFLNRIQQQLATLGGGGEVRLEFLDDVDRTTAKVDGKFLKYDASTDKWVGASASGASFSGTAGQFLQHNGTEFVGVGSTAVTDTIRNASQGFYGYTTDFYTVGVANTVQELGEDEYDLVMPQVAVGGTYSYLPTRMHTCNNGDPWVGSGATIGTGQTEFSLAGTIARSTVLVRFAYDFRPDVDDSDLDLRLHFTTNTATQTGIALTNFDIDKQGLVCAVGAGVTYSGETLISFFVGDTLSGDTKSEAGRFCIQANASDGGELEVKALNIIVDV